MELARRGFPARGWPFSARTFFIRQFLGNDTSRPPLVVSHRAAYVLEPRRSRAFRGARLASPALAENRSCSRKLCVRFLHGGTRVFIPRGKKKNCERRCEIFFLSEHAFFFYPDVKFFSRAFLCVSAELARTHVHVRIRPRAIIAARVSHIWRLRASDSRNGISITVTIARSRCAAISGDVPRAIVHRHTHLAIVTDRV